MYQIIFFVIIGIIVFDYFLGRWLEYINQKYSSHQLPEELKGIYDEEKYKKSQEYDKVNFKFSLITSTFGFVIVTTVLAFGGFGYVDALVRTASDNPIIIALLFFGSIYVINDIFNIPFAVYHTFVIEEKYGFNRTTVKTFISDKLKGYLLGIIIGGGLLSLFVAFYEWAGQLFWLYIWIVASIVIIFVNMFYTSLILPLFNKLAPLENNELRTDIEKYAKKVNFPLVNIFVMDGSKRSSKANAFFSGMGKKKKIVLFDTLIKDHTKEELISILAHEVGHYKKKHTHQGLILSIINSGIMLYVLSLFINNPSLSLALGAQVSSFHIGIMAFGILYSPFSMLIGIFMNILSRKNEFEADNYAALTYNGNYLKDALKKLSVNHLSNLKPHPFYVFFYYSHPPLLKRIEAIERSMKNLRI